MYALYSALEKGDIDKIMTLFSRKNYHDDYSAALNSAVHKNKLDMVVYLVSQGADVNAEHAESLYLASGNGNLSMVKYLISQNADIRISEALSIAARLNRFNVVRELIKQSPDIHHLDDRVLKHIVKGGYRDIIKLLLDTSYIVPSLDTADNVKDELLVGTIIENINLGKLISYYY